MGIRFRRQFVAYRHQYSRGKSAGSQLSHWTRVGSHRIQLRRSFLWIRHSSSQLGGELNKNSYTFILNGLGVCCLLRNPPSLINSLWRSWLNCWPVQYAKTYWLMLACRWCTRVWHTIVGFHFSMGMKHTILYSFMVFRHRDCLLGFHMFPGNCCWYVPRWSCVMMATIEKQDGSLPGPK